MKPENMGQGRKDDRGQERKKGSHHPRLLKYTPELVIDEFLEQQMALQVKCL